MLDRFRIKCRGVDEKLVGKGNLSLYRSLSTELLAVFKQIKDVLTFLDKTCHFFVNLDLFSIYSDQLVHPCFESIDKFIECYSVFYTSIDFEPRMTSQEGLKAVDFINDITTVIEDFLAEGERFCQ